MVLRSGIASWKEEGCVWLGVSSWRCGREEGWGLVRWEGGVLRCGWEGGMQDVVWKEKCGGGLEVWLGRRGVIGGHGFPSLSTTPPPSTRLPSTSILHTSLSTSVVDRRVWLGRLVEGKSGVTRPPSSGMSLLPECHDWWSSCPVVWLCGCVAHCEPGCYVCQLCVLILPLSATVFILVGLSSTYIVVWQLPGAATSH